MRIAVAWLLGVLAWGAFVAVTSIGPVVLSVGWNHGVHATDVLLALLIGEACLFYTLRHATRLGRQDPPPRGRVRDAEDASDRV